VRGYADQLLRVKSNPYDPSNRRVSILVKNRKVHCQTCRRQDIEWVVCRNRNPAEPEWSTCTANLQGPPQPAANAAKTSSPGTTAQPNPQRLSQPDGKGQGLDSRRKEVDRQRFTPCGARRALRTRRTLCEIQARERAGEILSAKAGMVYSGERIGKRLLGVPMTIVAGVDFGTLSVRVTLVDSKSGPLEPRLPPIHCTAAAKILILLLKLTRIR